MGDRQVKELRKQLRNVVEEILPEVLKSSTVDAIMDEVGKRMRGIEDHVKQIMGEMNERNKDTNGYLIRQAAAMNAAQVKPE